MITLPYEIGAEVWHAKGPYREEWVLCPDCAGQRVIIMTLGTGEQVTMDCGTCSYGFNPPTGSVRIAVHERTPIQFKCLDADIYGDSVTYKMGDLHARSEDLFATYEACADYCAKKNAEHNEWQTDQLLARKKSQRSHMAFCVGHIRKQINDRKKEIAQLEARLSAVRA